MESDETIEKALTTFFDTLGESWDLDYLYTGSSDDIPIELYTSKGMYRKAMRAAFRCVGEQADPPGSNPGPQG